ncbi:MAG TPA: diacylglycerol kinase family protein [Gaiellales bacterium]|nr:diacylglycerol kinase family protein [Gaiellales bacterium]
MSRRLAAILALLAAAVALAAAVLAFITDPLSVVIATGFLLIAVGAVWAALTHRGPRRAVALVAVAAALVGAAAAVLLHGGREAAVLAVALVAYGAAARRATRPDIQRARAGGRRPRTAGAVLLINPRSGDGRAGRANLVEEARARGIRAVELQPGQDLKALAEDAAETARVLGMAGGDGSQALVSEVAMRHDLPYVCIPAGTRNHFALDLGLDPTDLVGCLDAFDADEAVHRVIDLAMVGDRVFVNNVSLGAYAESVAIEGYREAKLRTMARAAPDTLALDDAGFDLRFAGPDGAEHPPVQLLLVSNNSYRFDQAGRIGSRPRLDAGTLGIVAVSIRSGVEASQLLALQAAGRVQDFAGWSEWTAPSFTVDSPSPIKAGVDGESLEFAPPLNMRSVPRAVTVMVPPGERPPAVYGLPTASSLEQLARLART